MSVEISSPKILMKRLSQLSFLLFALFVILGTATVPVQAATLNVTVTDAETGNKLNGVSITVTTARGNVNIGLSDASKASGAVSFTGLAAGDYTITAFLQGYTRKVTNITLATDGTESIEISLEEAAVEAEAEAEAEAPEKSPLKIGGALRLNYVYGTYGDEDNPHRRGDKIGDVDLEIFRLNADLDFNNVLGRVEYRWYDNYSFIHTAWLGYNLGDIGTLKAGIVRVPFGPTPYGVSTSWFFDQHFYVGLADDPDVGIRWDGTFDKLALSVGYYPMSEPQTDGGSLQSSLYGYDVVKWEEKADKDGNVEWGAEENGYEEQHQFNLRAIYALPDIADLGVSLQYGLLKGTNVGEDDSGTHYAFSGHLKSSISDFTFLGQFTYYAHNITDDTPWGTGDLIPMGAYNFAWPVASEGLIPAVSLRYGGIDTSSISWLDSVTPYVEFSTILKTVEDYNPSNLVMIGASWTVLGALYVYSDMAISNGNFFVGDEGDDYNNILTGVNHVGVNGNDIWHWRLNFNFGYYF